MLRLFSSFALLTSALLCYAQTPAALTSRTGNYEVSVRLPPEGLFAGEEAEIEFHIVDVTQVDPVLGPTPLIRGDVQATISMPAMPGMPKFHERAHIEGVPGDYGIHPTFAHGGEFQLVLAVKPLSGPPFTVEFPLPVGDAQTGKTRKKLAPAFRMDLTSSPKTPKAGEPARLELTFRGREAAKEALTEFDIAHERLVHLVIVREDLGTFAHVHPEMSEGGSFRIAYAFPTGGEYRLFADVAPKGAGSQVLSAKIKVSGASGERFNLTQTVASANPIPDGDLAIGLQSSGALAAKKTVSIIFTLKDAKTGSVPEGMEPYLGAKGHLLMVSQDGSTFVHAHPDEDPSSGSVTFLARFPKPGLYRAWAQFQRHGVVRTASFVIKAQ